MMDPPIACGIVFILLTLFYFITKACWRRRFIDWDISLFLFFCFSFILMNHLFDFFPLRMDSVEEYIPGAQTIAEIFTTGEIFNLSSWKVFIDKFIGFTFPLGIIFSLSYNSVVAGSFLASIFGALTIFNIYQITDELCDRDTAVLTAILLTFSPYFIFISSVILRDTMVYFFIAWFYRLWLLHEKKPSTKIKFLMVFSLCYAGILRPPIMLVMIASAFFYKMFFDEKAKQHKYQRIFIRFLKYVSVSFGVLLFGLILNGYITSKTFNDLWIVSGIKFFDIDEINRRTAVSSEAGSAYYPNLQYSGPTDIITILPFMTIYFMASPFPWDVTKATIVFAFLDSMMLWLLYLFFIPQIRSFYRSNKKWAVILFSYLFMGILSAAVVQTNIGAALRHRIMFTMMIIPFAARQLVLFWKGKRGRENQPRVLRVSLVGGMPVIPGNKTLISSNISKNLK